MASEYLIYADESSSSESYYSDFYGGLLVRSRDLARVQDALGAKCQELHLHREVKWSKVTSQYLEKYLALMDLFFDFVARDVLKVRIMFTQNFHRPLGLTSEHRRNRFGILYYHFLKHAFGLPYSNPGGSRVSLRVFFDQLPGTKEQNALLKGYIVALRESAAFRQAGIWIEPENVVEVASHDHTLMQCLDVALGSIQFRLNDKHLHKPDGARQRGKRTLAKERLYRAMNRRVRELHPNFNVGISTGLRGAPSNLWHDRYRHWCFRPAQFALDYERTKK
jgi:hypothetical protein